MNVALGMTRCFPSDGTVLLSEKIDLCPIGACKKRITITPEKVKEEKLCD